MRSLPLPRPADGFRSWRLPARWRAVCVLGVLAAAGVVALPAGAVATALEAIVAVAAAQAFRRARRRTPAQADPAWDLGEWSLWLFAAGLVVAAVGGRLPAVATAAVVAAEVGHAAAFLLPGVWWLWSRRGVVVPSRSMVDTAIVVTALTPLAWLIGLRPLAAGQLTASSGIVLLHGVGGLALTGLWTFVLLTRLPAREAPVRLLAAGLVLAAAGDGMRGIGRVHWPAVDLLADPGPLHLLGGVAFIAACVHPRWDTIVVHRLVDRGMTTTRALGLGLACLVPPVLALAGSGVLDEADRLGISLTIVVTVALLVGRLVGMLVDHEADRRREHALSAGLSGLLVATDRTTIELAGVLAARNLVRDAAAPVRHLPGLVLPTPSGEERGCHVFGPEVPRPQALAALGTGPGPGTGGGGGQGRRPWLVVVPTAAHGEGGWMVLATAARPSPPVLDALVTLGAQLGLACARAELTDDLQRRRGERRLASLIRHASDVIVIVDESMTVRYESGSITAVLGYSPDDLEGGTFRSLLHPDDGPMVEAQIHRLAQAERRASARLEARLRHRSAEWLETEITVTNLLADPDVGGLVLNIRDVSERKVLEAQLLQQAFHDPLTGLANRALLADRVEHALARRARGGPVPSVLFIDLDDFKTVNDSLGHPAGDRLLIEIAERITASLRHADTAARLGGDEFGVLVEDSVDGSAVEVGERILDALARPVVIDGTEIVPRASIGAAGGAEADSAAELLRNADLAMYIAKAAGGGMVEFEPQMHDSARRRLEVQAELSRALERGEFELHFQPLVALGVDDTPMVGVEALVRWNHPVHGRVPPLEFVPVAEETGLIVPLGRWILEEACRTVARWAADGLVPRLSLTVNVSARQLQETTLVDDVAFAVSASGLDPSWLVVEITESVVMRDTNATVGWLQDLKRLGVRIAIDDFGTGYSSLAYLQRFPIDVMKIDRSFVCGLGEDPTATELVRAVLTLADSLGMTTLAEGIETDAQLDELRRLGCRLGQGFAFAQPMSAAELEEALRSGALPLAELPPMRVPVSPPRG